jgi:hypothetical protein
VDRWQSGTHVWTTGTESEDGARFAYWRDRDMALDHDHCFLCGITLSDSNRSDEHVFPKWIQRRFNLWNEELTLLNGTRIRYRSLTIPCCQDCNTYWLSQVEAEVASAFEEGHRAVAELDRTLLCLWMWKLYYGIHFKEVALPADRREADSRAIVSPGYLGRFAEVHHVLQAVRQRVRFQRVPGSVFVYEAQVPERPEHQFDYRDSRLTPFLAVRAADTVIMVSFDWEAMAALIDAPRLNAAASIALHPFQFAEVAAFGAYLAAKFNRAFAYLVRPEGDHDFVEPVLLMREEQAPDAPFFEPMDVEEWAVVLAEFLQRNVSDVIDPSGELAWTSLINQDGTPAFVSLDQAPFGTDFRPDWTRAGFDEMPEPE